jgi:peptide/nickel transport system substrate-binding protein
MRSMGRSMRMALAVAASLVVLSACGGTAVTGSGSGQPKPSGKVGEVLTLAQPAAPKTLDPTKETTSDRFYAALAYQPLIVQNSAGDLQPGLALSWHYVGTGNMTFVLALRPNVKFSDGSAFSAQGVVDHFSYLVKAAGQQAPMFAGYEFAATGPLEVTVRSPKPDPDLAKHLSQNFVAGDIVSPTGLSDPSKLGGATFGAGPYQIDPVQTVAGSQYTYVPNPNYYDKTAVHWKKVVVKVMLDPQSTLAAMQTGQVNLSLGDQGTVPAAKRAGLTVTSAPQLVVAVTLADRGGTLAKPLADVRVRQALNYATDRASIAKALYADSGGPTMQLSVPGAAGYDAALEHTYPYDVAKAKALLSQAGYPNGFTLDLFTTTGGGLNLVTQAVAQQWGKAGVTVKVNEISNASAYRTTVLGEAKAPAFTSNFSVPVATEGSYLYLPNALYNPFRYADPALQSLYNQSAVASPEAQAGLDKQIMAYLVQQAWFVPIVSQDLYYYASKNITGTTTTPTSYVSIYEVQPAT